jgi:hypothetical protein
LTGTAKRGLQVCGAEFPGCLLPHVTCAQRDAGAGQTGVMAVHLPAQIVPGKLELLQEWVPHQPWLGGSDASTLTPLGSYRFDDPDGEVGMETHLLQTADGQVLQVPLTYRGAPRPSGDASLITTMTHTLLGDRWVYDGCHDPVFVTALTTAIVTGGREAEVFLSTDDGLVEQPLSTHVRGNGPPDALGRDGIGPFEVGHDGPVTRMVGTVTVTVFRIPTTVVAGSTLTGTWPGQEFPQLLARLG